MCFQSYALYFFDGKEKYDKSSWEEAAAQMERAVAGYLEADERCRLACEKPFDMGWFPDFITSVASQQIRTRDT
jgi:hypothetical protein